MTGFLAVDDACPIVLEVEERKDTIQYYVKPTREAHDGVKSERAAPYTLEHGSV